RRLRAHQHVLDLVGCRVRVLVEEVGHDAGYDRGCLRGAAAAREAVARLAVGVVAVDVGAGVPQADDVHPRRKDVGVTLVGTGIVEVGGRPAPGLETVVRVVRTDRADARVVRGGGKLLRPGAVVTPGGDDHDAVTPRDLGRIRQRVDRVG